jgi:hypothetical protein
MRTDFVFERIFCATPGDLELERRAFQSAVAEVNEHVGLARSILLVPVCALGAATLGYFNEALRDNVRACRGFIQVLGGSWGPPLADNEGLFDLALACRDDFGLPMQTVAVFLKDIPPQRREPAVLRFREKLAEAAPVPVLLYADIPSFEIAVRDLLTAWHEQIAQPQRKMASTVA